ncbi:MAG: hypothetical protein GY806_22610 [Gammaproteobacteria bacterium]|nr:hypothetical protein [Gammaproteobacteria bacterium]
MSLFSQLLYRISALCRCRIINGPDRQPYLERYHLLSLPFGYRFYLHRFVASDPGRGLHNHPWHRAFSVVLSGCYEEIRMLGARDENTVIKRKVRSGNLNCINGSVFHRINLIENRECWTLFMHSPSTQAWGFLRQQNYRYAFHDHNEIVQQPSNPKWWKTANRPFYCPDMRKPLA